MKKFIFNFFLLFSIITLTNAQNIHSYYHHKDTIINLSISTQYFCIYVDTTLITETNLRNEFRITDKIATDENNVVCYQIYFSNANYNNVLRLLRDKIYILDIEPVTAENINISRDFYIKFKDSTDYSDLQHLAENHRVSIIGEVPHCNGWYKLRADKNSRYNSLICANKFYETGLFANVDPGFIIKFEQSSANICVTDSLFDQQWGLDAVKACSAWKMTKGDTSIRVAVIDGGIDTSHREFEGLNTVFSYDITTNSYPAGVYISPYFRDNTPSDPPFDLYHGIHVGGIIFANHNKYGVAGMAPDVSAMDISIDFRTQADKTEKFAAAINIAIENGAKIINNSWKVLCGFNSTPIPILEDAIDNAIDSGRVLVFVSGNNNNFQCPDVSYPAKYRPEILVIGAIDKLIKRYIISNFGQELDLSAPGVGILSTHNNNGYLIYDGTSMAAPFVAGTAGLMLSINPNLSAQEVLDIIETTIQKIGSYTYYDDGIHLNGLYTDYIGYGVLDAHRAVLKASFNNVYGDTLINLCDNKTYTVSAPHNQNIDSVNFFWTSSDNLKILSDVNSDSVEIKAVGLGNGTLTCNVIHDSDTISSEINITIHSDYANYDDISLNTSIIFPDTFFLNNTIFIDSAETINWLNSVVYCLPETRFFIQPGGKLIVDGGTLTSSCAGEMWQGIEVVGNSNKRQLAQYQGTVELKNGATIENTICAIRTGLKDDTEFTTTGGIIKAENANFKNNARSIEINSYAGLSLGGTIADYSATFKNCNFVIDNNNLFSQNDISFTEHAKLWDVKNVKFYSCNFTNSLPLKFNNSYRAIYAEDAGFTVSKTCPNNIFFPDCVCSEYYSAYNSFSGFKIAIEANTTGNQYTVKIDQSRFSNNNLAIRVNGNNFVTITRDSFDITHVNSQEPFQTGIYLNNCSGYKVEENFFKGYVDNLIAATTGIMINNSGIPDNTIYRNTFQNLNYGMRVSGNNGNANSGLQIACAEFKIVASEIFLANNATMKSTQNVTINNCVSTLCGITPGPIEPIISANNNDVNSNNVNNYSSLQFDTYCEIIRSLMSDTLLNLSALQRWHAAAQSITDDYSLPETEFQMRYGATASLSISPDETHITDASTNGLSVSSGAFETITSSANSGVSSGVSENAAYQTFVSIKTALNAYSHINWYNATDAQIAELQTIAEDNSGRASELAKGVLCFFFDICYDDEIFINDDYSSDFGTKSLSIPTDDQSVDNATFLRIFPNPSRGNITIELPSGATISHIAIYDLLGRVVMEMSGDNQTIVETCYGASLHAGTYILRVIDNVGATYNGKLIIEN